MLKNVSKFYLPSTLYEACQLLADKTRKNVALAGGTHLGVIDDSSIDGLVDLKRLSLNYIKKSDKKYLIGATTPVQDIYKSSELKCPAGNLLKTAAGRIGSTLLRNAITIGGNITAVFPWSDLPPTLLVLEAEIVITDGKKERILPAQEWFSKNPREHLKAGEIVSEIQVPQLGEDAGTAFTKVTKTRNDFSIITVAVRVHHSKKHIERAFIALNAVSRRPIRCEKAEQLIVGKTVNSEFLQKVGEAAMDGLVFTSDIRVSNEYRRRVLPIYIRRTLESAIS